MRHILVTGVPGAGKTTVSRKLAETFERAVHIEGDVLRFDFVISGLAVPGGPAWDDRMRLGRRNICLLAESYAAARFVTVVDDVVPTRVALESYAGLPSLSVVVLAPSLEVVEQRDRDRDKHVFSMWSHLDAELRRELAGRGL